MRRKSPFPCSAFHHHPAGAWGRRPGHLRIIVAGSVVISRSRLHNGRGVLRVVQASVNTGFSVLLCTTHVQAAVSPARWIAR